MPGEEEVDSNPGEEDKPATVSETHWRRGGRTWSTRSNAGVLRTRPLLRNGPGMCTHQRRDLSAHTLAFGGRSESWDDYLEGGKDLSGRTLEI